MILKINDNPKKVYIKESSFASVIEGIKSTYNKDNGYYNFSINTSKSDIDNTDVDTRLFGNKHDILYGDDTIKDKRYKQNKSLDRYRSYGKMVNFYYMVLDYLERYVGKDTFSIAKDFYREYDIDAMDIPEATKTDLWDNLMWVALGKQSLDSLIQKYKTNLIKNERLWNSYEKPVKNARSRKFSDNMIPRYRVMRVPFTDVNVISLFKTSGFNFSDALKHGNYRQDKNTDKTLGIEKGEREKVSGTRLTKRIPIVYDNGVIPDIANNFSLGGDLSRKSYGYEDHNYTSVSQFMDKSIMGAAYALKTEGFKPNVIIDAPSSSNFNKYYCTRLSSKLGIPYYSDFFERDMLNAKIDEDSMHMDNVDESYILQLKNIIKSAGISEIAYFIGKPIDIFFNKYKRLFSNVSKRPRRRGRPKKYASYEDELKDLYISPNLILIMLKSLSFEVFANNAEKIGIMDNLYQYFDNAFNGGTAGDMKGDCDAAFVKRTVWGIISSNGSVLNEYMMSLRETFKIYSQYRNLLLTTGVKVNFSNDRVKIVRFPGKFRKYVKDAYIVANQEQLNNPNYYKQFISNKYVLFDEDVSTGSTLKLLIEALKNNGVKSRNILCLTNAYSLTESVGEKSIPLKEFTESTKNVKGVIFDFDLTLVDTTPLETIRNNAICGEGEWNNVYSMISQCKVYPGIKELISYLETNDIQYAVVTKAKQKLATDTLAHFGIKPQCVTGFRIRWPKAALMRYCLNKMGLTPEDCISVGDSPGDALESEKAGIKFIGCTWGNNAVNGVSSPIDIIKYIQQKNGQLL